MIIDFKQFPSGKQYACVREEKSRVFLRNIAILVHPADHGRIVAVREWGSKSDTAAWEPPKGQMEWKEFAAAGFKRGQTISAADLLRVAREGMLRELAEEAKIHADEIRDFQPLPLSYNQPFEGEPAGTDFRYQFWHGVVTPEALQTAQRRMHALVSRPERWAEVPADRKEKDAVAWWKPTGVAAWRQIRGGFSRTLTHMYYDFKQKMRV